MDPLLRPRCVCQELHCGGKGDQRSIRGPLAVGHGYVSRLLVAALTPDGYLGCHLDAHCSCQRRDPTRGFWVGDGWLCSSGSSPPLGVSGHPRLPLGCEPLYRSSEREPLQPVILRIGAL